MNIHLASQLDYFVLHNIYLKGLYKQYIIQKIKCVLAALDKKISNAIGIYLNPILLSTPPVNLFVHFSYTYIMTKDKRSPYRVRLLKSLLRTSVRDAAASDYEDRFEYLTNTQGIFRARLWYWGQILNLIPVALIESCTGSASMLKNQLKIALRILKRQKGYSLINISGLAIGIACCVLILLWVQDELSFDRFHENSDHIYRIVSQSNAEGISDYYAVVPLPLAPTLKDEYPEVQMATRQSSANLRFRFNDEIQTESGYLVDPDFVKMFSFKMLQGDTETCLADPFSIVITEKLAIKYFGDQSPIGRTLTTQAGTSFKVEGLLENIPHNSHLQFDFVISFAILEKFGSDLNNWNDVSYLSYVLLQEDAVAADVNQKITATLEKYRDKRTDYRYLQPLKDIHLRSHFKFDMEGHGDIHYVYIFSLTALFILLIACINFMNLATARSAGRAKEVGIRKVIGARRSQVIKQFFSETLVLTLVAFLVSMGIVIVLLPAFSTLSGKELSLVLDPVFIGGILGIIVCTGMLAGSYPALYLSAFRPVKVLRGRALSGKKGSLFRRALVITQFTLSIILIIGTLVVYNQIHFMKNANLGFNRDHLLYIPMSPELFQNYETVKQELLQDSRILKIAAVDRLPIFEGSGTSEAEWEGKPADFQLQMRMGSVDYDFLDTFGLTMKEGRFFSNKISTDKTQGIIINEAAVKAMGMSDPIGKRFSWSQMDGTIIGVIQDYQLRTLHHEVEPMLIFVKPDWFSFLCVKISSEEVPKTIAAMEKTWQKFSPELPFTFRFFDDAIDTLYRSEERIGTLFKYFTLLAFLISSLGLFGLAAFVAEQRTKEIGIRKILGATIPHISVLLSLDFLKWVIAANLLAWPTAYFIMDRWLQNFARRTGIELWIFALAGGLSLLIALMTISFQTIRAALSDPVKSLRYE